MQKVIFPFRELAAGTGIDDVGDSAVVPNRADAAAVAESIQDFVRVIRLDSGDICAGGDIEQAKILRGDTRGDEAPLGRECNVESSLRRVVNVDPVYPMVAFVNADFAPLPGVGGNGGVPPVR
jgi:hypothetical protein